jgi:cysteinyl-tRNA synthetase
MSHIKLYNTKSKQKEEFKPIKKGEVGLYTCGPTVYNYAHIGNLRTYIFEDILKRVLEFNAYKVKHVMNVTDVGHLTGDRDMGEDKLEKGAQREGKTAWEIAEYYTKVFLEDLKKLNIKIPAEKNMPRATAYINEQIDLIKILEEKGYTYITSDGVYFDTAKFKDYNKLNHKDLESLMEGARVEKNEEKKNPTDFALWKFSPKTEKRQMEWSSPWGKGFPGWHIECSAMSQALLGDQLDIHCGGIDHVDVHHTNEIAQSEAAYEKPFFNFWMHGAFLNIQGGKKMAKSDDNFLTLERAFIEKGLSPLVYRFACLQTHYRKPMEYSEEIMKNAENGYEHLKNQVRELGTENQELSHNKEYYDKFVNAINDDLNMPQALAVLQEVLKSDLAQAEKLFLLKEFDKVLGLDLFEKNDLPDNIKALIDERNKAREDKDWEKSDKLRDEIEAQGYVVKDSAEGTQVYKK